MALSADRKAQIAKARKTLAGNYRTELTQANPDGNIFDQMDDAESLVSDMTDKEVIAAMLHGGLVWTGKHWMKQQYVPQPN